MTRKKKKSTPDELKRAYLEAVKKTVKKIVAGRDAAIDDVIAERDALAARVMELEKQVSQPCTRSHGEGVTDLRKFISDCLKSGMFNQSVATELLK